MHFLQARLLTGPMLATCEPLTTCLECWSIGVMVKIEIWKKKISNRLFNMQRNGGRDHRVAAEPGVLYDASVA